MGTYHSPPGLLFSILAVGSPRGPPSAKKQFGFTHHLLKAKELCNNGFPRHELSQAPLLMFVVFSRQGNNCSQTLSVGPKRNFSSRNTSYRWSTLAPFGIFFFPNYVKAPPYFQRPSFGFVFRSDSFTYKSSPFGLGIFFPPRTLGNTIRELAPLSTFKNPFFFRLFLCVTGPEPVRYKAFARQREDFPPCH